MEKQHAGRYAIFKHSTALSASLFFNLFLVLCLYYDRKFGISWSWRAAKEAEVVSATPCSGHGRAFLDGPVEEGNHVCECYSCYSGPDCSEFSECLADADSGNPLFLEPFWLENEESSAVMVRGLHRMGYSLELAAGGSSIITDRLQQLILRLHTVVGNANVTGRFVAIGVGSMQLINAAVRALSASNGSQLSTPSRIVATPPFYSAYKSQSEYMNGREYKWGGDTAVWKNRSNPSMKFIEFVTSPNNPDGMLMTSVMEGRFTKSIYDHAYYWPHFSPIPSPADEDLMLFSLSKSTGHAGSRFGWALVKDEEVYNRLTRYVMHNTLGVSRDTQLRAMRLLEAVLKGNGRGLFEFGHRTMSKRWQRLSETLAKSRRFSLQKLSPQYCTFFGNVTGPSPAYAWIKCEMEEDDDCYTVLKIRAGIIGRAGSVFGSEDRYVRLSLIKSEDDFDWLIHKLQLLVANEVASVTNLQDHYNCANV